MDLVINRDLSPNANNYSVSEKPKRNASQEDVGNAFLKVFSNIDLAACTNVAHIRTDAMIFLANNNLDDSPGAAAFNGNIARLGGISQ